MKATENFIEKWFYTYFIICVEIYIESVTITNVVEKYEAVSTIFISTLGCGDFVLVVRRSTILAIQLEFLEKLQ